MLFSGMVSTTNNEECILVSDKVYQCKEKEGINVLLYCTSDLEDAKKGGRTGFGNDPTLNVSASGSESDNPSSSSKSWSIDATGPPGFASLL